MKRLNTINQLFFKIKTHEKLAEKMKTKLHNIEITVAELRDADILFLNGKSFLAKQIKKFQLMKYKKDYVNEFGRKPRAYAALNHVGTIYRTKYDELAVFEQDHPGKFKMSMLDEEYLAPHDSIYIGRFNDLDPEKVRMMLEDMFVYIGSDKLLNYSFKSYGHFIWDAIKYKVSGKESKWKRPPKGETCSQVVAKYFQRYHNKYITKDWWKWYPFELACFENITIYKLMY